MAPAGPQYIELRVQKIEHRSDVVDSAGGVGMVWGVFLGWCGHDSDDFLESVF